MTAKFLLGMAIIISALLLPINFYWFGTDRSPLLMIPQPEQPPAAPDFSDFQDLNEKKRAFIEFMLPKILAVNQEMLITRQRVQTLQEKLSGGEDLAVSEIEELAALLVQYRLPDHAITDPGTLEALLIRVDVVPASLALAQAANESAWGTSRFANDGNNFYGLWCFTENCGEIPLAREDGKNHKLTEFSTVQDGVAYYFYTLNTHPAYDEMRLKRAAMRESGEPISGARMAEGLLAYSERGQAYVEEIQSMIRVNNLQRFNLPYHRG